MKKTIIFSLISIITLAACSHKEPPVVESNKNILSDTMMSMIRIDSVTTCNIDDEVALNGQVSFNENNVVKIFPRSSGQIIDCRVSLGDKVSRGQVLATIKSADIAGNYSDLSSANADLAIAKRQMENTESLYKNGISSEREYTEAKQNYEKALAAKSKVSSTLSINGGTKSSANGQYQLTSPIDGYVVEKKVAAGSYIRPDMGDYLFTISDLKTIWIYANVYEADIPRIKQGDAVNVTTLAYPTKVFAGKIDNISEILDAQSKALRARISLDNSAMLLKPDMFAKVIVDNREGAHALCIPTSALISQDGKNYVVIYNNKDDIKVAELTIIKTVGDRTYISTGVTAGQHLIVKNQLLVFNQLISSDTK
jgi:cobalt-zinc-cadmium efflux system membrane fusion protein